MKNRRRIYAVLIMFMMFSASALAIALRPTERIASSGPKVELETLVPQSFGSWQVDRSVMPVTLSPDVQAKLNALYSQTLSRTYVNGRGERIMLSVAYGSDQSDEMQVHKPEVCYPAQGFSVLRIFVSQLQTSFGVIPVKRLVAEQGARVEPITYWVTVGTHVTRTGTEHKLAQLRYGLTGRIPDGLLFRVSSINRSEVAAFALQDQFVQELLNETDEAARLRLVGNLN